MMLPPIDRSVTRRRLRCGFVNGSANLARRLRILRKWPGLQTSMTVVMRIAPAAVSLFRRMLLGLNALRTRFAGAPPAFAGCVGSRAIWGVWVFRNGGRNLRLRYHGSRRTRALLAPPLAAPRPSRPLLLPRIRRTRFKRLVAGIGVAHLFVHSRRAKTFRPQQALARFIVGATVTACREIAKFFLPATILAGSRSRRGWSRPDPAQKNPTFAP
jgi:hypothetical protein